MYQDSLSPTASILVIQHPDRPGLSKALNVAKRSAVVEEIEKEGQRKITRTPAIGSTRDVGTSSGLNSFLPFVLSIPGKSYAIYFSSI